MTTEFGGGTRFAGGFGTGHIIEDEGTPLAQRVTLNFIGTGVTATDDPGNNATNVTISAGGHVIEDEGTPLAQRADLNFVGAGVTAADVGGKTVVTIPGGGGGDNIVHVMGTTAQIQLTASLDNIWGWNANAFNTNIARTQIPAADAFTFSRLTIHIFANTSNAQSKFVLLINGVAGNSEVIIPAGTAGTFQDLVNTDSIASGDLIAIKYDADLATSGVIEPKGYSYVSGTSGGGGSAYNTIEDEGTPLAQRTEMNFVGAGVTAVDSGGKTVITIPGGGGVEGHVIEDEGTPLTQQTNLNFVGAGVTAADSGGKTVVTIPGETSAYRTIEDEGTPLAQETVLNFVGAGVTASAGTGETVVTIPGGITQAYETVQDEGTPLTQRNTLNFVGAGVTAADSGGVTTVTIPAVAGNGHVIEDEGTPVAQQSNMNFVGAGVTVADSGGKTVVTIPGASPTGYQTIQDEGNPLAQQDTFNFIGAGVTAVNNGGSSRTDVTIPGPQELSFIIAASDEVTDLTIGDSKVTLRMPFGFTLTKVKASVTDAPTGSTIIVNIREGGVDILSTPITIDANERTSETAVTPPVISDANLAADAEMKIDLDQIGSTLAGKGLKVTLIGDQV